MQDLPTLITPLLNLCKQAGERIVAHYHSPHADQFKAKGDDSPLTHADLDSHHCLQEGLTALTPDYPVLSEESTKDELAHRREWKTFWMVDPLDGTKEFLGRTGEFTINVALIHEHKAVLGLLYLPLEEVGYVGIPGQLARRYAGDGWLSTPVAVRELPAGEPMKVLASRRHRGEQLKSSLAWIEQHWGEIERLNSGSALKFTHLAEGGGDFYPRFSPCCEWDTAAGQAIVEAAGGAVLGLDGKPLRYNARRTLMSPYFLAIAQPAHPLWAEFLQSLEHENENPT